MTETPSPTVDGAFWKQAGGEAWLSMQGLMERLYQPVSDAILDRLVPETGWRVADIGCGGGATTLDLARRIGPSGQAIGVDVSAALLASARRHAEAAGLTHARFIEADAQTHDFGTGALDAMISRFGVMFFADPIAAFINLRGGVLSGGEMVFAVWRRPEDNPMALLPAEAVEGLLPDVPRPTTEGPGRFAFADADRVRRLLTQTGWRDVAIAPLDVDTPCTFEDALTLSTRMGVLGPILPTLDQALRARVIEAVGTALEAQAVDGVVPMQAACWLVTGRA